MSPEMPNSNDAPVWFDPDGAIIPAPLSSGQIPPSNAPLHPLEWARPTYGYRPDPLLDQVFIKPVPRDHQSLLIIPKAYEAATDQGFVSAVGPDAKGIKVGDLVLFDRFAKVGKEFELLDEENESVQLVCIQSVFVFAILKRVKL